MNVFSHNMRRLLKAITNAPGVVTTATSRIDAYTPHVQGDIIVEFVTEMCAHLWPSQVHRRDWRVSPWSSEPITTYTYDRALALMLTHGRTSRLWKVTQDDVDGDASETYSHHD